MPLCAGAGCGLQGIEARFLQGGHPRDLTVTQPVMVASRKASGINRFVHDGLMRRVLRDRAGKGGTA